MMQFLVSIGAFLVAVGIMVTVHEFGHYWVARRCGVKVLRFCVGFGRPLWRRRFGADETEWMIAALPLGGYVKMLDEREVEVDASERHRAFNRQTVGRRAAVVAAGPAVNILLAAVMYSAMFMLGVQGLVPKVGEVGDDTPAAEAGFRPGERIVSIDGVATPSWSEARLVLLDRGLAGRAEPVPVTVRGEDGYEASRRLDVSGISLAERGANPVARLGLQPWFPERPARITRVEADSPAAAAGLQAGDRVVRAGGAAIADWQDLVRYVRARPSETVELVVEREGTRERLELTPARRGSGDAARGYIGAAGPEMSEAEREQLFTTVRHGPLAAIGEGMTKTWDMTTLTLRVLWGLVTGTASLSNISGPVSIAQFAGQSAQIGLATFLGFIGLISISIGILNLLPIPVLDGGHLLYYAIEAVTGSPLSERAQMMGQQIGISLLFALLALALYNDFVRLVY